MTGAEGLEIREAGPHRSKRGRRITIIVLSVILIGAACGIMGLAFVQGSWWYTYGDDQALDRDSRARLERTRDAVADSGAAPHVVTLLNAALDPDTAPTDARTYLLAAQEALEASDDPQLAQVTGELQEVIQKIRPAPLWETSTPRPLPDLEWSQ
jgi:hypothetical protein